MGWKHACVGDVGHYINGMAFKPSDWEDDGRPIIRIQNLTDPSRPFNQTSKKVDPKFVVRHGDILVSWSATLDAFVWRGPEAVLNQHIFKVEPNRGVVTDGFLFYQLRRVIEEMWHSEHTHGSTMKHINRGPFLAHPFWIAPLDEQHRIVAAIETHFSRLDAIVASLTRAKANVKRARASVLKAAVEGRLVPTEVALARSDGRDYEPASVLLERILAERKAAWTASGARGKYKEPVAPETERLSELADGWCWATVDELAGDGGKGLCDGPFGSNLKSEHYVDIGPRVVRLQNISDGVFRDERAHITDEHFESLRKHEIKAGDLVIASLGETSPRACIIPDWLGSAIVKADCIRFSTSRHVSVPYLNTALNSPPIRKRTTDKIHGIGRPRLGLGGIREITLPLPPLAEQHRIAAEVDRRLSVLDALDESLDINLARCARLRQAVLKRAFEGRLVPPAASVA